MGETFEGCEGLLSCFVDVVFGHLEEVIGLAVQSPWVKSWVVVYLFFESGVSFMAVV